MDSVTTDFNFISQLAINNIYIVYDINYIC